MTLSSVSDFRVRINPSVSGAHRCDPPFPQGVPAIVPVSPDVTGPIQMSENMSEDVHPTAPSDILPVVMLVILLMIGVGAMYMISTVLIDEEERTADRDFFISGTSEGTAHATYYNEGGGEYIYTYSFDVAPVFDETVTIIVSDDGFRFSDGDHSDLGTDEDGLSVVEVRCAEYTYTLHMDNDFVSHSFTVEGDGVHLFAILTHARLSSRARVIFISDE